jgi:hypothetical protein
MELELIQNTSQIEDCSKLFYNLIEENCEKPKRSIKYSTKGGSGNIDIMIFKHRETTFWFSKARNKKSPKQYNLFGVDPDFERENAILVQINYQKEFKDFKDAAVWARDEKDNFYLLHSGKMGGGVPGMTIETIDSLYGGKKLIVSHQGIYKEYFVVCKLNSPRAFLQLNHFLIEILKIKTFIKQQQSKVDTNSNNELKSNKKISFKVPRNYTPEFWGKRRAYFRKGKTESTSDHGAIVDALKFKLESDLGYQNKCVNNKFIDLGITKNGKPLAIFEIKTSVNTQSIYTAIGQLMLHSSNTRVNPLKFAVLPSEVDDDMIQDLKKLSIDTIRFSWVGNTLKFYDLESIPKS